MRRFILALLAAVSIVHPSLAAVRVGEVSAPRVETTNALRAAANEEVAKLDVRASAIVSVALVRLEKQDDGVTCVVSVALRSERGNLYAILEGRAQGRGNLETQVLRTAVHGAISRIPAVLR